MPFVLQYFKTKHATKHLTADITITSKILLDKPIRKYSDVVLRSNLVLQTCEGEISLEPPRIVCISMDN